MITRHKMLGVTYDWESEKAVLTYSFNFNSYSKLEKLDSSRHTMLKITYDWETEIAKVVDSAHYENYTRLEKMDSLSDVINVLQLKYDNLIEEMKNVA